MLVALCFECFNLNMYRFNNNVNVSSTIISLPKTWSHGAQGGEDALSMLLLLTPALQVTEITAEIQPKSAWCWGVLSTKVGWKYGGDKLPPARVQRLNSVKLLSLFFCSIHLLTSSCWLQSTPVPRMSDTLLHLVYLGLSVNEGVEFFLGSWCHTTNSYFCYHFLF